MIFLVLHVAVARTRKVDPVTALLKVLFVLICWYILQRGWQHWLLPLCTSNRGLSVVLVKRFFKFIGRRYATNEGRGITFFIVSDTSRVGRWWRRISWRFGKFGCYVTTNGMRFIFLLLLLFKLDFKVSDLVTMVAFWICRFICVLLCPLWTRCFSNSLVLIS